MDRARVTTVCNGCGKVKSCVWHEDLDMYMCSVCESDGVRLPFGQGCPVQVLLTADDPFCSAELTCVLGEDHDGPHRSGHSEGQILPWVAGRPSKFTIVWQVEWPET